MSKVIEQIVRLTTDREETKAEVVGEIVRCKYCKHRPYEVPAKYDSSGKCVKYAYITSPDDVCPYLCDDSWYNRIPEDRFFCGFGERKETEDENV